MDRYIQKLADVTIENDVGAKDTFGMLFKSESMSQERYLKRIRSICYQQAQADTYALGKTFDVLFADLKDPTKTVLRCDGEHWPALAEASRRPQGLFNGLEITQLGPFQEAVMSASIEPPKSAKTEEA